MEHAFYRRERLYDIHSVLVGLPFVDDDGKSQLLRQGHLHPKCFFLNIPGDILIVIVQANLSDGLHLWVAQRHCPVCFNGGFGYLVCRVWMRANGGIHIVLLGGQRCGGPGGGKTASGIHHKPDALGWQRVQQCRAVFVKCPVVQVSMGVKNHGESFFLSRFPDQ